MKNKMKNKMKSPPFSIKQLNIYIYNRERERRGQKGLIKGVKISKKTHPPSQTI